jgi:hypothetical protein
MKKKHLLLLVLCFAFTITKGQRKQTVDKITPPSDFLKPKQIEFRKGKDIFCPLNAEDAHTFIPSMVPKRSANARISTKSTFIVEYVGFPAAAKNAFQAAVDIWAGLITSPVPIRVIAYWSKLESNTIGSASPNDFTRNFPGQQKANVWYPIALAEKLAGKELNSPNDFDVRARFNSDLNWSFSGKPEAGQYDFTTLVLHELTHGLGFWGSWGVESTSGSWGFGTGSPVIYDTFMYNNTGIQLVDTSLFANNSIPLRAQITSENVVFNGVITNATNSAKPRIFSPKTFQEGSSMSHLEDKTYPSGDKNSLMKSASSRAEVILDPGPLVKSMMADMGWSGTQIVHEQIKNSEKSPSSIELSVKITTDNILKANSPLLYYTENDTLFSKAKTIALKNDGKSDIYKATVPITKPNAIIRYYFRVEDDTKRTFFAPAEAPRKGYYGFQLGVADVTPPNIFAEPINFAIAGSSVDVFTFAEDDYEEGIDTLYVEYLVNGQAKPSFGLRKYNRNRDGNEFSTGELDELLYLAKNPFGRLNEGDRVQYRFVAIDKAAKKNKEITPAYFDTPKVLNTKTTDYFEIVVIKPTVEADIVKSYSNNFDKSTSDFASVGFSLQQPPGFTNSALHTIHPYKNGGDINGESNLISLLTKPIRISSLESDATMTFDEIVLVEPGENGAVFGDGDFYDYVIVEGSYDGGQSWEPFEEGYDSGFNAEWLKTFASSIEKSRITIGGGSINTDDSKATGTPKLFQKRKISLLSPNTSFQPNDVVQIRFRLFSDNINYGWGWAIDNLAIQSPEIIEVILANEPSFQNAVQVFPNPTSNTVTLKIETPEDDKTGNLVFFNAEGRKFFEMSYEIKNGLFSKTIDIEALPEGLYFMKFKTKSTEVVKKLIVKR